MAATIEYDVALELDGDDLRSLLTKALCANGPFYGLVCTEITEAKASTENGDAFRVVLSPMTER